MKWMASLAFVLFFTLIINNDLRAKSNLDSDRTLSIYNINSNWINQDGTKMSLHEFEGKPLVMAMIYTSCPSVCPLIISDIKNIEQTIPSKNRNQAHFVLISFDPSTDNSKRLIEFSKKQGLDLKHWTLLTGTKSGVRELATALGIQYKRNSDGSFAHSNVITLIDRAGNIRHQQIGLKKDPKPIAQILHEIIETQ